MRRLAVCFLATTIFLLSPGAADAAEWSDSLYLDGAGYWSARIPITLNNERTTDADGEPFGVTIGADRGQVALVGLESRAVRVTNSSGVEMRHALIGPDGRPLTSGPTPLGSQLVLPVECEAQSTAVYYVYFNNPAAGELPDFLPTRAGLINGDVEPGSDDDAEDTPGGWKHDAPDATHRATWSDERPQSGVRCLKTTVAPAAEPTWIATRQSDIHLIGGARYRMTAWVRAEDVEGMAGWYLHVGNRKNPQIVSPMLSAGSGTFDWKQVTAEFTVPDDADMADLGTVLRGSGTAWFDNLTLECIEPGQLTAVADPAEQRRLKLTGAQRQWEDHSFERRTIARIRNFKEQPLADTLVSIDVALLEARAKGRLDKSRMMVTADGRPVDWVRFGDSLLFSASVPARCERRFQIYFNDGEPHRTASAGSMIPAEAAALPPAQSPEALSSEALSSEALSSEALSSEALSSEALSSAESSAATTAAPSCITAHNRVTNPGFEDATSREGSAMPDGWTVSNTASGADRVVYSLDTPGRAGFGQRCARLDVPEGAPITWRGWTQRVAVEPGQTYLFAAWVKCQGVDGGDVRLHAHRYTAAGTMSASDPMTSVAQSITGDTDWTLLSGRFTMPDDTTRFHLHLTTDASGTVWHDGVVLTRVSPARISQFEGRPVGSPDELHVWPVPSVVKVFPDDPAPGGINDSFDVSCARNERETLQLAIRSGRAMDGLRVEVDSPVGANGATLKDVTVNVVGLVPIDYPTSYYSSRAPSWRRMKPSEPPQCDGWPGLWPDPLLPSDTFPLKPNATRAVWLTVNVPKNAPSGKYRGRARLVSTEGRVLFETPFSVYVWDFTLPDESHLAAIYDARLGPGAKLWGESLEEIYPDLIRYMAERRLCPDTIRPAPDIRWKDGRVVADFAAYDEMATLYFDELNLPFAYTPWTFYLFGWGHPPKDMWGERPYDAEPPYDEADRSVLRPEYKEAYQACLRVFWDHLKEKGWSDRVVLYISDEPFDHHDHIRSQMTALCEMIHEVDADIPIYSSTWRHIPDWDGSLDVWGIGHDGRVPVEKMRELRAAGDRLWFTTDGQMCTDTPYCAVERLLPHYCFQNDVEAYEFWGVGWLTYDPYRFGWHAYIHQSGEPGSSYWVRYPNGDGFLLYPGDPLGYDGLVGSIRLEQAREGVEDYEYLYLLRRRIVAAKQAGRDTSAGHAAMEAAAALVEIPNAGGRYSSRILPNPAAIERVRTALGEAIEAL